MYIIKIEATKSGSRPPLQRWGASTAPRGYALCSEDFYKVFYSTNPSGFVNIVVKDGVVTEMTVNQEAIDDYLANLPEPVETVPEPSVNEILNTLLGV
jgi:hypothetical protein